MSIERLAKLLPPIGFLLGVAGYALAEHVSWDGFVFYTGCVFILVGAVLRAYLHFRK